MSLGGCSDINLIIYRFPKMYLYFKIEEFLKSDDLVYFTQLFYEFQHHNPVILFDVYLTSSYLRTEQSEFTTFFQYTNTSVHKHSVWFLGNSLLACIRSIKKV